MIVFFRTILLCICFGAYAFKQQSCEVSPTGKVVPGSCSSAKNGKRAYETGKLSIAKTKSKLRALRYLLFDGHAGPLQSMYSFLVTQLGVPNKNIGVVCHLFGCQALPWNIPLPITRHPEMEDWVPLNHDFDNMEPLYDDGWNELFRQKFQKFIDDKYDVILCTQPARMCGMLRVFGKPVVLRMDKRFDHRVGMRKELLDSERFLPQNTHQIANARRESWIRQLADWSRSANPWEQLILLSANPYDQEYVERFTGVRTPILEAYPAWPRWSAGCYTGKANTILVFPDQEGQAGQRRAWEHGVLIAT